MELPINNMEDEIMYKIAVPITNRYPNREMDEAATLAELKKAGAQRVWLCACRGIEAEAVLADDLRLLRQHRLFFEANGLEVGACLNLLRKRLAFYLGDDLGNAIGRLSALLDPLFDLLEVEGDRRGIALGIVGANLLDDTAIATLALVGNNDAVKRGIVGTMTCQTDNYQNFSFKLLACTYCRRIFETECDDGSHSKSI